MGLALEEATRAAQAGEVPVGAVVVLDGRLLGAGHNAPDRPARSDRPRGDPRLAGSGPELGNYRLTGVTLSPPSSPA